MLSTIDSFLIYDKNTCYIMIHRKLLYGLEYASFVAFSLLDVLSGHDINLSLLMFNIYLDINDLVVRKDGRKSIRLKSNFRNSVLLLFFILESLCSGQ
jgi:hypothetical protein